MLRVKAPVRRFSSTVRCWKQWRTLHHLAHPHAHELVRRQLVDARALELDRALVTSPRSACRRLEIAFSVVGLAGPFAPRSATIPLSGR